MQTAALPTSESSSNKAGTKGKTAGNMKTMKENLSMKGGELKINVLSVYDLPTREQPSYVSVTACGATVTTGPPTSRHKDRNSFKFGSSSSASDMVLKAKKLEHLYGSLLKIEVNYENKPWLNLSATYAMKQLHVHESTWLVLTLDPPASQESTAVTTTTATSSIGMEDVPPSIRLKVQLRGPYRPEIAALLTLSQTWFAFMDSVEQSCQQVVSSAPQLPALPHKNWLLVPAVPVVTGAVVIAPILAGACVLFMPVFVPVLAAILTIGACLLGTGFVLYSSTSSGRQWLGGLLDPAAQTLLHTQSGQSLVFEIGPRPTPVSVARVILPSPSNMWGRLALSLFIDLIGNLSYIVPVVGEVADIGWAPLQTVLIMAMYDTTTPHLKYVSFVEEILPFTDFIPSATIGWAAQFGPKLLRGEIMSGDSITSIPSSLTVPKRD